MSDRTHGPTRLFLDIGLEVFRGAEFAELVEMNARAPHTKVGIGEFGAQGIMMVHGYGCFACFATFSLR